MYKKLYEMLFISELEWAAYVSHGSQLRELWTIIDKVRGVLADVYEEDNALLDAANEVFEKSGNDSTEYEGTNADGLDDAYGEKP